DRQGGAISCAGQVSHRQDLLAGRRCRLLHHRWYVSSPPSSDVPARPLSAIQCDAAGGRYHTPAIFQGNRMGIKFEAVDKNGTLHKRASASRFYSHCGVSHFAAHPPSKFGPKGVTAYSRAEWAGSIALAERSASRWRKEPDVEAIEILEARQLWCRRSGVTDDDFTKL